LPSHSALDSLDRQGKRRFMSRRLK